MDGGITFQAHFARASTTVDGGWRVSFDVDQDAAPMLAELAKLRQVRFQLALVPIAKDSAKNRFLSPLDAAEQESPFDDAA
jgi:hypothetical protein